MWGSFALGCALMMIAGLAAVAWVATGAVRNVGVRSNTREVEALRREIAELRRVSAHETTWSR